MAGHSEYRKGRAKMLKTILIVATLVGIVGGAFYLKYLMMKPLFDSLKKHLEEEYGEA
jgi:hypothetical protein